MKTIHTGWRTVTPGKCFECGFDDGWEVDGRGTVFCSCQRCYACQEEPGWHASECVEAQEAYA